MQKSRRNTRVVFSKNNLYTLPKVLSISKIIEDLESLGVEVLRTGLPAMGTTYLLKTVVSLMRNYFDPKEIVRVFGFRNPDVIVGQSTNKGAAAELVESRTVHTPDRILSPEAIKVIRDFLTNLFSDIKRLESLLIGKDDPGNLNLFKRPRPEGHLVTTSVVTKPESSAISTKNNKRVIEFHVRKRLRRINPGKSSSSNHNNRVKKKTRANTVMKTVRPRPSTHNTKK